MGEKVNAQEILGTSKIGLWRGEYENGAMVRLYADDKMDELLGITAPITPEERAIFFSERICPDDRELFLDYIYKLSENRTEIVYRYIHPVTGEMIIRCGGIRDLSSKQCLSVIGVHQDISDIIRLEQQGMAERRLAEQNITLRREQVVKENYYRDLLDVQNCGLMAYTLPERTIIHMNAEARRMYCVTSIQQMQQELGSKLRKVFYPDKDSLNRLHNLMETDDVVDYECILNHGTEEECHVMAKTKTIRMPSGERVAVTTFLDVSDMIMLRDALQQAEEGNRAKTAFLFAMSHDLRTPMNAIIGYGDLIQSHWEQENQAKEYLKKLQEASRFLLELIGNVLEVSRIENGKESLREEPWDLRQLTDTLDILGNEFSRKRLRVTTHVKLTQPLVFCDGTKVQEILMNLLSNAVKYTPAEGEISLELQQIPSDRSEDTVLRMVVQDTGIGIAQDFQPRLFEAFSRERDSSQSGIAGTGLGLQIVKSFVDLMGGTIQVESTPGQGSRFTVELPMKPTDVTSITPIQSAPLFPLEGGRVLLAEDNALNAEITGTILRDAGMRAETAENGAIALEMLKAKPIGYYDLILMDIQMPGMNGYEATRAIRSLPDERSKILIIAMTANAFEEDRQAALSSGMDEYASKPIRAAQLQQVISDVLRNRESQ